MLVEGAIMDRCPDEMLLAAFIDFVATDEETKFIVNHLGYCSRAYSGENGHPFQRGRPPSGAKRRWVVIR